MLRASITGLGDTPVGKLPGSTATSLNNRPTTFSTYSVFLCRP